MFNKDLGKKIFKQKPKLNDTLKESPYTCKECSNPLMIKGRTYLTCNCNDCLCFGEEVEQPLETVFQIGGTVSENGVPMDIIITDYQGVSPAENVGLGTLDPADSLTFEVSLNNPVDEVGNPIQVTAVSFTNGTNNPVSAFVPASLPLNVADGNFAVIATMRLANSPVSSSFDFEITVTTDAGTFVIPYSYTTQ
jgi:hypothetical protein